VAALASASALAAGSPRAACGIAWAFGCMHFGYGIGFGHALADRLRRRRGARDAATRLTR
jgi:hypothetical protein